MNKFDIAGNFTVPFRRDGKTIEKCIEAIVDSGNEVILIDVMEATAAAGYPAVDTLRGGVYFLAKTGTVEEKDVLLSYLKKFNYPADQIENAMNEVFNVASTK